MKLPEEMPLELNSKILSVVHGCECEDCHSLLTAHYKMIAYYFNNLPVDWRPVSEKVSADKFFDVFIYNSYTGSMRLGHYNHIAEFFFYEDGTLVDDNFTFWTYAHIPEPPKEITE